MTLSESIISRRDYIMEWIERELKAIPVTINSEDDNVFVKYKDVLISEIQVGEDTYRIFNITDEQKEQVITYNCEKADDGTWFYYVDSAEECIESCRHIVIYEATKKSKDQVSYANGPLDWNGDIEDILKSIKYTLSKILEGTEYYVDRNKKPGEKDIDLFKKGQERRIGQLWPKKRRQCVELTLPKELLSIKVRQLLPQPKSQRANDCYYPESTYELMLEVFEAIAEEQRQ